MASLENKKILLAANNSAINKAILEGLLLAGANVIVLGDLSVDMSNDAFTSVACVLSDLDNLEATLKPQLSLHKPFDGFVFAAGKGGVRPLSLTKPDFLHDMMRTNLYIFIELSRLLTKKDLLNEGSSIVALSSVSSTKGLKSKIAYTASKAALDAAVRSMAAELAVKKIRVNSIQKGWVSSDMSLDFIENNRALSSNDDFKKQLLGAIEPDEIAGAVQFLLSNTAKSITGTALVLDGGYTI
jgi:NAD(P)-dependent dehydrogenase (short-subunit alcohol dehydrogenase family)